MIENELVKIWQSSPNQERVKFEKSRLMIDVQSNVDLIHRKIKYRDIAEQLGAILVSPVFIYYAFTIPFLLTKIASILIVVWAMYVIFRIRQAKKHKPGAFTDNYLQYLHKTRDYLVIQKDMIDNVLYWYILPAMILMFMFILGPGVTPERISKLTSTALVIVVTGIAIYYLNKRAVKKQLNPRLEKIDKLIGVMAKEE
jgi:protein-S-isoprenylcysteine O-methyltransferase Ste14